MAMGNPAGDSGDGHVFRAPADAVPLDGERLAAYLESIGLPLDRSVEIRQFATGMANRNYRLTAGGRDLVLRRPPDGELPPGAHDMAREHRILSRLGSALPLAPTSVHLCEDRTVIGAPFQLIEYRPGLVIKGDDQRPFVGRPDVARRTGRMLVETLVAIHQVDAAAVGLGDLGKPEGFFERAVKGWVGRAERVAMREDTAALAREIGAWLGRAQRRPRMPTLLHSDFKLDNLILDPATLQPVAIVDWDMGTRGDPLLDLATLLSYWVEPGDPDYLHELRQLPTVAPGFPSRDEVVTAYAALTGVDVDDYPVHRVLALMKLAVVLLQLDALYRRGAASGEGYASLGRIGEALLVHAGEAAHGRAR